MFNYFLNINQLQTIFSYSRSEVDIGGPLSQNSNYNFYKFFGYDILLDSNLKPHLIEINSRYHWSIYVFDRLLSPSIFLEALTVYSKFLMSFFHLCTSNCCDVNTT